MTDTRTPRNPSKGDGPSSSPARERILKAAARLMTVKAPSQITGRELAKAADVNYGLVHHYFGSKNNACQEAFRAFAGQYVKDAQTGARQDWILNMGRLPEYQDLWRILAHAAMDGESLDLLGWDYPLLRARLAARAAQTGHTPDGEGSLPAESIATAFSLALGWTVFQPFIKEALGLESKDLAHINDAIVRTIDELW
ncbi:TetR/AcrR family transcriptional regulator [Streptomyces hirsutus]|uniref:TetR/AcrR family transcriptional regulator n=1 Tax=Streptomyces hirsutus TaxID=35620 RepID=UPI00364D716D